MANTPSVVAAVLYSLWWPASALIRVVRAVLAPIWAAVCFVFLPVTFLVRAVLAVTLFPFRIHVLERIEVLIPFLHRPLAGVARPAPSRDHIWEVIGSADPPQTMYIWLGVAGLLGCIMGGILFLVFRVLASAFNIDATADAKAHAKYRTMKDRGSRTRREWIDMSESSSGPTVAMVPAPRRRGLSSQAIMEEESEF